MRTLLFLLTSFFIFTTASAQNDNYKWGKLTQAEFDMTAYDKDPEAEAVVLFDIGLSQFIQKNNTFVLRFTRTRRIKILDESGISFAEFSIPFYYQKAGDTEIVTSIKAVSYNYENSQLVKSELNPSNIYEEVLSEHWKTKKVAVPNVKVGTVVEYKYVIESPFHFNLPDWKFQDRIPTIYSRYTAEMIPFYEYVFIAQGFSQFSHQSSEVDKGLSRHFGPVEFKDMVHTYVMKNVPAFRDESFMTSSEDYIMKIDFQLAKFTNTRGINTEVISTWEKLKDSYLKHADFGKYVKKGQKTAVAILESNLNLSGMKDEDKIEHIVKYVKNEVSWNGYNAKYASKSCKDLLKEKTGNAADINLFLTSMLQAAGLNATPALISTRNHGKINSKYPFSHLFNYVVVVIDLDGGYVVTDATETNVSCFRMPLRCMNETGLLIKDGEVEWLNLNSDFLSRSNYQIEINIDPEQLVSSASMIVQATDYESYTMKERFESDSSKFAEYLNKHGFESISKINFGNHEDPKKTYFYAVEGEYEMEVLENNIIIKPFLYIPPSENRLIQKKRTYPVDFVYAYSKTFTSTINIPENYVVVDLPDKIKIDNATGTVILQYEQVEDVLTIKGEYAFKQAVYTSSQYEKVKFYMKNIVKIFNTPVVLKKKEVIN